MARVLVFFSVLTLSMAPAAHAEIFLELVGQTQGAIQGESTFPGEENRIAISSFSQGGFVLYQPGMGVLGRDWSELTLTKEWDPSSIKILRAQGEGELLTTCVLRLYDSAPAAVSSDGLARRMPHLYLTVELINARITHYDTSASESFNASESLSLSYDAIRYTNVETAESFLGSIRGPGAPKQLAFGSSGDPGWATLARDSFEFVVPEDGFVGIDIVDVDGRHVTTLFADDASGSDGFVRWDRTDADGRKVAAGVYTATVRTADAEVTRRMVVGN